MGLYIFMYSDVGNLECSRASEFHLVKFSTIIELFLEKKNEKERDS